MGELRLDEFGCFTGDCPHGELVECFDALKYEWLHQADRISALERTQIPPEIVERVKASIRRYEHRGEKYLATDALPLLRDITAIGEQESGDG